MFFAPLSSWLGTVLCELYTYVICSLNSSQFSELQRVRITIQCRQWKRYPSSVQVDLNSWIDLEKSWVRKFGFSLIWNEWCLFEFFSKFIDIIYVFNYFCLYSSDFHFFNYILLLSNDDLIIMMTYKFCSNSNESCYMRLLSFTLTE